MTRRRRTRRRRRRRGSGVGAKRNTGLTVKYRFSKKLQALVGLKTGSRMAAMKQLWLYIRRHNLQDPKDKRFFTPDPKMKDVFGENKMKAIHMTKYLAPHLSPMNDDYGMNRYMLDEGEDFF